MALAYAVKFTKVKPDIRSTKHKEREWKENQARNICSMVNLKQLLTSLALEKIAEEKKNAAKVQRHANI